MKLLNCLSILSLIFLAGCATTAKYEAKLNTWIGQTPEHLINTWGYPAGSFDHPNGNRVYVYSASRTVSTTMPGTTYLNHNGGGRYTATTYGGATINSDYWCKTFFEVGPGGKIDTWKYEGNDCKSSD